LEKGGNNGDEQKGGGRIREAEERRQTLTYPRHDIRITTSHHPKFSQRLIVISVKRSTTLHTKDRFHRAQQKLNSYLNYILNREKLFSLLFASCTQIKNEFPLQFSENPSRSFTVDDLTFLQIFSPFFTSRCNQSLARNCLP
jgi:hypothetical protein